MPLMPATWSFSPCSNHSETGLHSWITWLPCAKPNGWSTQSGLSLDSSLGHRGGQGEVPLQVWNAELMAPAASITPMANRSLAASIAVGRGCSLKRLSAAVRPPSSLDRFHSQIFTETPAAASSKGRSFRRTPGPVVERPCGLSFAAAHRIADHHRLGLLRRYQDP
jgi:hypothetical protein